jgi:hypothetical protein
MASFVVAAYDSAQQYGGPEEGGWWFDAGSLVRIVRVFRNEDRAYSYCRRLNDRLYSDCIGPNAGRPDYTSVLSYGRIVARVYENVAPAGYPDERPHYE